MNSRRGSRNENVYGYGRYMPREPRLNGVIIAVCEEASLQEPLPRNSGAWEE